MIISRIKLGNFDQDVVTSAVSTVGIAIGIPPIVTEVFVASMSALANQLFSAQHISEMFGARRPRFTNEECLRLLNSIWVNNLGKNPTQADVEGWFKPLLYGYESVESLTNIIRNTDEYKQRKAYMWDVVVSSEQKILGRTPTTTPENDEWFKQLMAGKITPDQFKDILYSSTEHKAKIGWIVPAIIAGSIFLL